MQMSEEERLEKVQRLRTAHDKTRQVLEDELVTRELHPGTDIARNWMVITAAYNGLEQTIKYLVADENGMNISELIELKEEDGKTRYPYRTHDLLWLFSRLAPETQRIIRDFYERFKSLHSYIQIGCVNEFLNQVSEDGKGYEKWRYTLIEDRPLPKNSPEALVSIWGVSVQIAMNRACENRRIRFSDEMLSWRFRVSLDSAVQQVALERQNAGEPFRDIAGEKKAWLWKREHPLNAFADVLWNFSRYGEHGQVEVSDWLSDALKRWLDNLHKNPAIARPTSLRAFVIRAQGLTPEGQGIRWDHNAKRFKPVQWSLENLQQEALPSNAISIINQSPKGIPLLDLWRAAEDSGYCVLENLGFHGSSSQGRWYRTHEVRPAKWGDPGLILTMWRDRDANHDLYYLVEELPRNALAEPVRKWIEMALRLREMRVR